MYLLTVSEESAILEASLGGKITREELMVFGEELEERIERFAGGSFQLLLDYSKASAFDRIVSQELSRIKEICILRGASRIVSAARDEHDVIRHTSDRMQAVLEGVEVFILAGESFQPHVLPASRARRAA